MEPLTATSPGNVPATQHAAEQQTEWQVAEPAAPPAAPHRPTPPVAVATSAAHAPA